METRRNPATERTPGPSRHVLELEEVRLKGPQRALVLGAALTLVCAVAWAATTKLPETAIAAGEVTTETPAAPVQHLEGGIVAEVMTKEGARVAQGQPLVRMDDTAAASELKRENARLEALDQRAGRLEKFIERVETGPVETEAGGGEVSADHVEDAALVARLAGLAGRLAVAEGSLAQSRAEVAALEAQIAAAAVENELLHAELQARERLMARGLTTRDALLEAKRASLGAEGSELRLRGALAAARGAVAAARSRLAEIRAAAIDEAQREAAELRDQRAELGAGIALLQDRLARTQVRAPKTGVVRGLSVAGEGSVLPPGAVIAEILPENVRLVADVRIGPRDIGFVVLGQQAELKFEAFDHARYGVLSAVVERISAGSFLDESGRPYHEVRLRLEHQPSHGPSSVIAPGPGMAVQAGIVTGRKTVLQYLLKPLFAYGADALRER